MKCMFKMFIFVGLFFLGSTTVSVADGKAGSGFYAPGGKDGHSAPNGNPGGKGGDGGSGFYSPGGNGGYSTNSTQGGKGGNGGSGYYSPGGKGGNAR